MGDRKRGGVTDALRVEFAVDARGEPNNPVVRLCLYSCGHIDARGPRPTRWLCLDVGMNDCWFEGEEVTFAVPGLGKHVAENPGVLDMIERALERFERKPSECMPWTSVGMVIKATSSLSDQTIVVQYRTDREKYRAAGRPALLAFLIEQLERHSFPSEAARRAYAVFERPITTREDLRKAPRPIAGAREPDPPAQEPPMAARV